MCSFIEAVNADVTQREIHFSSNKGAQPVAEPSHSQKDSGAGALGPSPVARTTLWFIWVLSRISRSTLSLFQ